jgi:NH3-dependent NAD+ synthetase
MSQVPVPGFIIGLSGTDSIVAYMLCFTAAKRLGIEERVTAIHYRYHTESKFEKAVLPWLYQNYSDGSQQAYPQLIDKNSDEFRWASLHEYAKEYDYWTVGTMNATEKALGKYSLLSTAVSIQPIQSLYKTTILEICEAYGVPQVAIDNSRIPDCMCGRDEFAAENIELIDKILRHESLSLYDPEKIDKAMNYIRTEKAANGFRDRVPYVL